MAAVGYGRNAGSVIWPHETDVQYERIAGEFKAIFGPESSL
jgi:hypothetical protein